MLLYCSCYIYGIFLLWMPSLSQWMLISLFTSGSVSGPPTLPILWFSAYLYANFQKDFSARLEGGCLDPGVPRLRQPRLFSRGVDVVSQSAVSLGVNPVRLRLVKWFSVEPPPPAFRHCLRQRLAVTPTDWRGRTSSNGLILCRVERKTSNCDSLR